MRAINRIDKNRANSHKLYRLLLLNSVFRRKLILVNFTKQIRVSLHNSFWVLYPSSEVYCEDAKQTQISSYWSCFDDKHQGQNVTIRIVTEQNIKKLTCRISLFMTRWFSRYVIAAPCWWTVNKRSLISSFCLSTSICLFQHC